MTKPAAAARSAAKAASAVVERTVRTRDRDELVDVTGVVAEAVRELELRDGVAWVYVPHTTAAVTINEGADPAVRRDLLEALRRIVRDDWPYEHAEGNSPAHVKASLTGSSVLVPVRGGAPALGRWQVVYLCEFDGPRSRTIHVGTLGGSPSTSK